MNNEAKIKTAARATFDEYLHARGLRRTPERVVILDAVMNMNHHFTIESLHAMIVEGGYRLSLGTVYNTVDLLVDSGLMRRHQFGSQAEYERVNPVGGNHLHLVCLQCGSIKELREPELMKQLSAHRYSSLKPDYFDLTVYGTCSKCQRRLKSQNTTKKKPINNIDNES